MSASAIAAALPAPDPGAPQRLLRHRLACGGTGLLLGLTQSFGLNLVTTNLPGIQGSLGATAAEASWLTTAYFAAAVSASLLLFKVRLQLGVRRFANIGLVVFLLIASLHLLTNSLETAIAARAALGVAAAVLTTLAILHMLEAFPPKLAPAAIVIAFSILQLGTPLSRVFSVDLLQFGQWHGLFLLDVTLAILSLAAVNAVQLADGPPETGFTRWDAVTFPLYALSLALFCVVLSQGRLRWWTDAPWLGVCLALAIGLFGLYVVIETHRPQPMIDLHWLARPYMLVFIASVLLFRVVLAEQTIGVVGLMTILGQSNDQMQTLFTWVTFGQIAGCALVIVLMARLGVHSLAPLAAAAIAIAAWLDSDATSLTRPAELYFSQTLMALGLAAFFGAACLLGFGPVFQEGRKNLLTFVAAFSMSLYMGSQLGTAAVTTYVADRQQWHYSSLAERLSLSQPQVATRVAQLGRTFGPAPEAARQVTGVAALSQQVTRESFVLAYNDLFRAIALVAAGMFVLFSFISLRAVRARAANKPTQA